MFARYSCSGVLDTGECRAIVILVTVITSYWLRSAKNGTNMRPITRRLNVQPLLATLLVIALTGGVRAETADSILANKKQQTAQLLPWQGRLISLHPANAKVARARTTADEVRQQKGAGTFKMLQSTAGEKVNNRPVPTR